MLELYILFDVSFFGVDEFADFEHVIFDHIIQLDGVVSVRIFLGEILFWKATILEVYMRIHAFKTEACFHKLLEQLKEVAYASCKQIVKESFLLVNECKERYMIDTQKTTSIRFQDGS